jgi:hypothetical protein
MTEEVGIQRGGAMGGASGVRVALDREVAPPVKSLFHNEMDAWVAQVALISRKVSNFCERQVEEYKKISTKIAPLTPPVGINPFVSTTYWVALGSFVAPPKRHPTPPGPGAGNGAPGAGRARLAGGGQEFLPGVGRACDNDNGRGCAMEA